MSLFPLRRLPRVHPVAAADYFGETWIRRTMALVFMNAVTIERNPASGQDPLTGLIEALRQGESLIFFPEGSRGEAGVVGPFRSGVGRIARALPDVPVVPVFLQGTERIWPRGEVVPVPLGIDVHVGKPRTYDPALEARQIAEEVRKDVLALAPAPAPLPGTRPPLIRVGVSGGDTAARRAIGRALADRLGRIEATLGVLDTVVEADSQGVHDANGIVPRVPARLWVRALAGLFRTRPPYAGREFAEMVARARIEESLHQNRAARFLVVDADPLLHLLTRIARDGSGTPQPALDEREMHALLVYLEGQRRIPWREGWRLAGEAPEVFLLNVLGLARLRVPNVLVLLRQPRGQEAQHQVADMLRRRRRVEVLELDALAPKPEAIAAMVEAACRRFVEPGSIASGT